MKLAWRAHVCVLLHYQAGVLDEAAHWCNANPSHTHTHTLCVCEGHGKSTLTDGCFPFILRCISYMRASPCVCMCVVYICFTKGNTDTLVYQCEEIVNHLLVFQCRVCVHVRVHIVISIHY